MPKIQTLSPHVADLIAAGEVVERPASVVKELVENSIDAGATSVIVEIQAGGMRYIRVTDNGCGMEMEDAARAFLRHATSKIRTEYDLEAIGTLGFRGEALAAISAVSRVELMTRTPGADFGASLLLEGGELRRQEEAGCPEGTTMIVRDLFYNTPARLKFMKRDAAEGAAVFTAVQHQALAHPEVSIRFLRDGKEEMLTPGDGRLQSALYAVLGRETALGFLPCPGYGEEIRVEGYLSRPACCRGTRACQHFFVNGRYVKSRTMTAALEEAYRNQKMVGRFPGCVLRLTCKLSAVDVNVHPAKTEVKFTNEKQLFEAVYNAARSALERESGHVSAVLPEQKASPARPQRQDTVTPNQTFFKTMTSEQYRAGAANASPVLRSTARLGYDRTVTPWQAATSPSAAALLARTARPAPPAPGETAAAPEPPSVPNLTRRAEEPPAPPAGESVPVPEAPAAPRPERPAPAREAPPAPEAELVTARESEATPDTPLWRLAGEVFHTYLIVEQGDKLLLIDKHAAHERMNFDRMKAEGYTPMRQVLLSPQVVKLSPAESAALLEYLELLRGFGFEAEDFGGGDILLREVPDYVDPDEASALLGEIAGRLLTAGTADPSAARDEVLHTMACKAAIKGGWESDPAELEVLARAVVSGRVRYCPHGRPVAIEMTRGQLERQFGR